MPASKSGLIRTVIGGKAKRLRGRNDEARALLQQQPDETISQTDLVESTQVMIKLIKTALDSLAAENEKWSKLFVSLPNEEQEEETSLYESAAMGEDGFQTQLFAAEDNLVELECRLVRLSATNAALPTGASITEPKGNPIGSTPLYAGQQKRSVKVPHLQLLRFSGKDPAEWKGFWDLFVAVIDESEFSDVQKLLYLKGQLDGAALHTIKGLPVTSESYHIALHLLQQRFERTDQEIVAQLYGDLKRIQRSSTKVSELQKTLDEIMRISRQLEAAGEDLLRNRSLASDILSKFPGTVIKELARFKKIAGHSTVDEITSALVDYVKESGSIEEFLENLDTSSSRKSYEMPLPRKGNDKGNGYAASSIPEKSSPPHITFSASEKTKGATPRKSNDPIKPCYFCSENHFNSDCHNYPSTHQRIKRLKELGRCHRCLGVKHAAENCRTPESRIRCFRCKTIGQHQTPVCPKSESRPSGGEDKRKSETSANTCALSLNESSILATAIVTVRNTETGTNQKVRAILDTASHRSYAVESLVNSLKIRSSNKEELAVAVFGSRSIRRLPSRAVSFFDIVLKTGEAISITAHTTRLITECDITPQNLAEDTAAVVESMKHSLADDFGPEHGYPQILIGGDYFWEFITGPKLTITSGLYLVPSSLGLLLVGRYMRTTDTRQTAPTLLCLTERSQGLFESSLAAISSVTRDCRVHPDIDEYFMLERIGISDDPNVDEDETAMEQFKRTVKLVDGRYEVCWPRKNNIDTLPDNYSLSIGRLRSLLKRLKPIDPAITAEYQKVIKQQEQLGIIESVPRGEINTKNITHYLPHHPVVKMSSSNTKVRVVYDASAKVRKDMSCLNECLYRGPVLLPDLCAVLLRFRIHNIAIVADIEKAFLQLSLCPADRDLTRFLWLTDATNMTDERNVKIYRFCRVPFGVISSPFLLGATIRHHVQHSESPHAASFEGDIYVDNLITGTRDIDSAFRLYEETKSIFYSAGMNMRDFCSNSEELLQKIPAQDVLSQRTISVLGINWNSHCDQLTLPCNWNLRKVCSTKREVLQAVASIFDPLGLFQPVTLPAKCFLRSIWESKVNWDIELSDTMKSSWMRLHASIEPIFNVRLNRRVCPDSTDEATIVAFSDASQDAYATAVYLRKRKDSQWITEFVYCKSRLAPKHQDRAFITLPRLELLGLTIAAKAAEFVRKSLNLEARIYLMCDSTVTLGWVNSTRDLPIFIKNRIKQIRQLSNAEFHHVGGDQNPADLATRGIDGSDIAQNEYWWNGPPWLSTCVEEWPTNQPIGFIKEHEPGNTEMSTKSRRKEDIHHIFVAAEGPAEKLSPLDIDLSRFSSYRKLCRVTSLCLRFIKQHLWIKVSQETRGKHPNLNKILETEDSSSAGVSAKELHIARNLWIKAAQQSEFQGLAKSLESGLNHPLKRQLDPRIDEDGIIRCYGRLAFAQLDIESIKPVLIPKHHRITELIIEELHRRLLHTGTNHVLNQLRREFWVPQGRNTVRKILNRCIICKKQKSAPYALPQMPPWPKERVTEAAPFAHTGVDYLGPIRVSLNQETKKTWVALFTCLVTRAVHLEPILDCTAQSFIDCISRFISRRGSPKVIISDNAPQFRVAKSLFDHTWRRTYPDPAVLSYIADRGAVWKFTTELAPWQGGIYERLVGLVKSCFKAEVGRRLLSWDSFITLIAEVEAIVNSRPITYVHSDLKSGIALRPMDFIVDGHTGTPIAETDLPLRGGEAEKFLHRYWKAKQRRLGAFWKRWREEYLTSMRERSQKDHKSHRSAKKCVPTVGEVVLIKNTEAPRGQWTLGRILNLVPSGDGAVRAAELILPNRHHIRRPINHLIPLEIQSKRQDHNLTLSPEENDEPFFGFDETEVDEVEDRIRFLQQGENVSTLMIDEISRINESFADVSIGGHCSLY